MELIDTLKEIQGDDTNEVMAARIGISDAMYSYIIREVWPPGRRTIRAIIKRYPHLKPLALEAMLHD